MSPVGFLDFIKKALFPPPRRDISMIGGLPEDEIDTLEEEVDLEGGPLKEHHRRRALRDRRLVPKKKASYPFHGKRKKYMTAQEAGRLFSDSQRTINRTIRDLLPDEEQINRYRLPMWRSEEDLAKDLGISPGDLQFFSIHREKERAPHYVTFSIPKRSGGKRLIMAPKSRLKALQRRLNDLLVKKLPVSDYAHGFRSGRSIRSGAEPHVGKKVVLHLDIKDFFPSVHFGRVRGYLVALGYGYPVATTLALLMTEAERQPVDIEGTIYHVPISSRYCIQGAPTSPGICNAITYKLDRRLGGLACKFGFSYTRYADDLTFSGDEGDDAYKLKAAVVRIIKAEGFAVHPGKTRIMRQGRRQTVTGVVVNKEMGLSRQVRRQLRAMAHQLKKEAEKGPVDQHRLAHFKGRVAYLKMLNAGQAQPFEEVVKGLG